jgi:hypothetical protein
MGREREKFIIPELRRSSGSPAREGRGKGGEGKGRGGREGGERTRRRALQKVVHVGVVENGPWARNQQLLRAWAVSQSLERVWMRKMSKRRSSYAAWLHGQAHRQPKMHQSMLFLQLKMYLNMMYLPATSQEIQICPRGACTWMVHVHG